MSPTEAAQAPHKAPDHPTSILQAPDHPTKVALPPNEALLNHPIDIAQPLHKAPDMSPIEAAQVNNEAPDNQTAQLPSQAPSSSEEPNPMVSQSLPPTRVSIETGDETFHSLPSSPPSYVADSPPQTEAGESGWSDWEQSSNSAVRGEPSEDESSSEESMYHQIKDDDGAKRCLIRRRLRDLGEAKEAYGRELDDVNVNVEKTTRKRKKG